jgi:hypothetical protein
MSKWSKPSPVFNHETGAYETDGFVWFGTHPVTSDDIWDLYNYLTSSPDSTWQDPVEMFANGAHLDRLSLVGTYHPDWSSHNNQRLDASMRDGGRGSDIYMKQRVGDGVDFTKEPIWFVHPEHGMVKEIPPNCGAHYTDWDSVNRAGPEPGSEAFKRLGSGTYVWNSTAGMYEIEGGDMKDLPPEPEITECPHCVAEFLQYIGEYNGPVAP